MPMHVDDEQILTDRIAAAVNSIMSGNNDCGTLRDAVAKGDRMFFEQMIRPAMMAYAEEAVQLRQQRDAALRDVEAKRFALECVISNAVTLPPAAREAVAKALPGRL